MLIKIPLLLLLIAINGVFAMAELALIGARRTRLQAEAADGHKGAIAALSLLKDSGRFLSTVSIGITLVGVIVSTIGGDSFVEPLMAEISMAPSLAPYSHAIALVIVVITISFCSVVLGELVPKRIAVSHPEAIATTLARPMTMFARLAMPVERVLSFATVLVLRLLPLRAAAKRPVTDEEINLMMREGAAAGEFTIGESAIVQMALRLGDRRIDAIMTPRTQIEWLDLEDGWEANKAKIRSLKFSQFPVVDGGHEHIVGILRVKDLVAQTLAGETVDIGRAIRPPLYIPDTAPALRVLEQLRHAREPLALIVDEYGDLEGLVTLHDILQALVGDIAEPGEARDLALVRRDDGTWLIDGLTPIETVEDAIGVHRLAEDEESSDFHTLGGFLMARMKRIPSVSDAIEVEGWRFEVIDMDGHRVDKVAASPVRNAVSAA